VLVGIFNIKMIRGFGKAAKGEGESHCGKVKSRENPESVNLLIWNLNILLSLNLFMVL
jgi:hypothetical protein